MYRFPVWLAIACSWLRPWVGQISLKNTLLLPTPGRQFLSWKLCALITGQESKGQKQVQPTRAGSTVTGGEAPPRPHLQQSVARILLEEGLGGLLPPGVRCQYLQL